MYIYIYIYIYTYIYIYNVKPDLLQTVYFAIIRYWIHIWGQTKEQNREETKDTKNLKKIIWILNFKWKNDPVNPV